VGDESVFTPKRMEQFALGLANLICAGYDRWDDMKESERAKWMERAEYLAKPLATDLMSAKLKLRDADIMAATIDVAMDRGLLDARSSVGDARLAYGPPFCVDEALKLLAASTINILS